MKQLQAFKDDNMCYSFTPKYETHGAEKQKLDRWAEEINSQLPELMERILDKEPINSPVTAIVEQINDLELKPFFEMGFTKNQIATAVKSCKNNYDLVIEHLLSINEASDNAYEIDILQDEEEESSEIGIIKGKSELVEILPKNNLLPTIYTSEIKELEEEKRDEKYMNKINHMNSKEQSLESNIQNCPILSNREARMGQHREHTDPYYEKRKATRVNKYPRTKKNISNVIWGEKEGKWMNTIDKQVPSNYTKWELKITNIQSNITELQFQNFLAENKIVCRINSFQPGIATIARIQCQDRESFNRTMYLGEYELMGRKLRVSFSPPGISVSNDLGAGIRAPVLNWDKLEQRTPVRVEEIPNYGEYSQNMKEEVGQIPKSDIRESYNILSNAYEHAKITHSSQINQFLSHIDELKRDNQGLYNQITTHICTNPSKEFMKISKSTIEIATQTEFPDQLKILNEQNKRLTEKYLLLEEQFKSLQIEDKYIKDGSYTNTNFDQLKELILPFAKYEPFTSEILHGQNIVTFYKDKFNHQVFALKRIDFHQVVNCNNTLTIEIQKDRLKLEFINQMKASESEYVVRPISLYFNLRYALFLMEYGGHSIDNYWLDPTTNLNYVKAFKQLAYGLYKMHGKLIHHGDIKPQNILFLGNTNTFKFIDFGASLTFSSEEQFNKTTTRFGGKLQEGTSLYLPPEIQIPLENNQIGGENIKWEEVDVFSLAFTIYSMIIKRYPNNEGKLKNNFHTYPQFLIMVEKNLESIVKMGKKEQFKQLILRCLSLNPLDRCCPLDIFNEMHSFE